MNDPRLFAPATHRNRDPILEVLRKILPAEGLAVEVASGTGEHVVHFAAHLPKLTFLPTDPDENARRSIAAWIAASGVKNVLAPEKLDAASPHWPVARADAILCINMIHISPWSATEGFFTCANKILSPGAPVYLYGPFKRHGAHNAPSNAAFDQSLRRQNPDWGVRDLEAVATCATKNGFGGPQIAEMPANNLSVIFRKAL